jgi:hypothetical protein
LHFVLDLDVQRCIKGLSYPAFKPHPPDHHRPDIYSLRLASSHYQRTQDDALHFNVSRRLHHPHPRRPSKGRQNR